MDRMKNILGAVLCFFSINMMYSQSTSIETDPSYLQLEKEFVKATSNNNVSGELDRRVVAFNSKFENSKALYKFSKDKDKERWLAKNIAKTKFSSVEEAVEELRTITKLENDLRATTSDEFYKLKEELIKKYGADLIWKTLKSRLAKE